MATYRPQSSGDEMAGYYAFAFENGKCKDAMFNIVCDNEAMAKTLQHILASGEWANDDDDDDNDDYPTRAMVASNPVLARALAAHKTATRATANMDTGLDMNTLPDKPKFGTWDEATGKYSSSSIFALPGTRLDIETAFNDADIVTKYKATFTMPNEMWAEALEEEFVEQASGYGQMEGITISVSRNGRVITTNQTNVETQKTTKANLMKVIVAMDILNARPIVTAFAEADF